MMLYKMFPTLAATAGHIDAVQAKLDQLTRVKDESWVQLLTATSRLFRDGVLSTSDLLRLAHEMRDSYGGGYRRIWDECMPISLGKLPHVVAQEKRDQPNGSNGSWYGTFPLDDQATPPVGVSVVYVLLDAENSPVYVGSTHSFRARMRAHRPSKRSIMHAWAAYPCRDRDHAYQLERELLGQYKLRLNRQGTGAAA